MRSNKKPPAFNDKPNAFRQKKLNAFTQRLHVFERNVKRIRTKIFPRSNEGLHAFERQPSRVRMRTCTCLSEDLYLFKQGPSRVRTRIYTRLTVNWTCSFHMWNAFALCVVSDGYCTCLGVIARAFDHPPPIAFCRARRLRDLLVCATVTATPHGSPGSYPCWVSRYKTCPILMFTNEFSSHTTGKVLKVNFALSGTCVRLPV